MVDLSFPPGRRPGDKCRTRSSYKAGELFIAAMMDRDAEEAEEVVSSEDKTAVWNPAHQAREVAVEFAD